MKGGLTDAGNTLAGVGGTVIHSIGDIGGKAIDGVTDAAKTVAGTVTSVANSVGHFLQSKTNDLLNIYQTIFSL